MTQETTASLSPDKQRDNSGKGTAKDGLAPIVAITSLCCFVIFSVYMVVISRTSNENQWNRTLYIFAATEAIAFGAAGFFFGSEVQRKVVEQAETRIQTAELNAEKNKEEAIKNREEAIKGKALASAIQALPSPVPSASASASALGSADGNPAAVLQEDQYQYVQKLVNSIYE